MRNFIAGVFAALVAAAMLGALSWILLLPRLDWGATKPPGAVENALASDVLQRWIDHNAGFEANPFSPTPANLKAAKMGYEAHCAACHNLDGSGRNRFEADFYPPVPKLTAGVQKLSDSEIYFIIAKGIRNTAMPAFEKSHSPDDMWRAVLWLRHLAHLTPKEQQVIENRMHQSAHQHEQAMEHRPGQFPAHGETSH